MTEKTNKKTVSYSQFSNWYICPRKWKLDYIDKLKTFEDNLIMTFGTAIHETIQLYLKTLFNKNEILANRMDLIKYFTWAFKKHIKFKKIIHTKEELNDFIEDGINILKEFKNPVNIFKHFQKSKWELLGIEDELNADIRNNVALTGFIDLVFREKLTDNIRIIDIKTSNNGWTSYNKEDFSKCAQLILYKALYSKQHNIPLSKINVEFYILKRKLYDQSKSKIKYEQSRIQSFKPSAHQKDVMEVINEFGTFVDTCFTKDGEYNTSIPYPKNPNGGKNCKYCNYLKNGKCNGKVDV